MKLTANSRHSFVIGVMQDVPQVDYSEKIRLLIQGDAVMQLPPKVYAIYQDDGLRHFVKTQVEYHGNRHIYLVGGCRGEYKPSADTLKQIAEWCVAEEKQTEDIKSLRSKIEAIARSCSTRKALLDMVPEFEKYMPVNEVAACRALPAVIGVMKAFADAGWPKTVAP